MGHEIIYNLGNALIGTALQAVDRYKGVDKFPQSDFYPDKRNEYPGLSSLNDRIKY